MAGGLQCTPQSPVSLTERGGCGRKGGTERHPTSHSEALPRAALRARVRAGLGSRVAGSRRTSAPGPGRQLLHSLPQQPGLDVAVGKEGERAAHASPEMRRRAACARMKHRYDEKAYTQEALPLLMVVISGPPTNQICKRYPTISRPSLGKADARVGSRSVTISVIAHYTKSAYSNYAQNYTVSRLLLPANHTGLKS